MPLDDASLKRIRTIQGRYNAEVKAVQGNADLSLTGRQKVLARLRHTALGEIAKVKEAAETAYWQRVRDLERRAFSVTDYGANPSAAVSFRDAQDRVAQVKTGHEAQLMMRRAIRAGDTLLCRALFDEGWQRRGDRINGSGWGAIIGSYVADVNPSLGPVVEELAALQDANTRRHRLGEQMETDVFMPEEVATMSHAERQQAVAEQEEAAT